MPTAFRYTPRDPRQSIVYGTILRHWRPFVAALEDAGGTLPGYVKREFEAYLGCGIPALGFARVRCSGCGLDRVVAFSCKGRGFCPSCGGRRMSQTAANLVDRIIPRVPVRQWVLTVPMRLRRLCRYIARPPLSDARLTALSDGRLAVRLKAPHADGTTHVVFQPMELMEKLAALVPPPRRHLIHYHGVLAPAAQWRPLVVPRDEGRDTPRRPRRRRDRAPQDGTWIPWVELLKRVFAIELFPCPRCGSRSHVESFVVAPTRDLLVHYGLPTDIPSPCPARAGPTTAPFTTGYDRI